MVKLVAVVGGKHAGKTTIIENVIAQLRSRGYRVGVVKEMVRIPTLDTPETETDRYANAGAEIVAAVPRDETVIFIRKRLTLTEILPYMRDLDYLLLEGFESEKSLPKIVGARTAAEATHFLGKSAVAVSGPIAESHDETSKLTNTKVPLLHSVRQADKLADVVEHCSVSL